MNNIVLIDKYKKGKKGEDEREFEQYMAECEKKREMVFKKRYSKVFNGAPDIPAARIKYFCEVLLKLVPLIADGDWEHRCFAHDDFCNIYMDGVDLTLQDWCRYDLKIEKLEDCGKSEYPSFELRITKENMQQLLTMTLGEVLSAAPETGDAAKKDFLRKLAKLFAVYREVLYVFMDEQKEKCEAGTHNIDYSKLEGWFPESLQDFGTFPGLSD